jgi:hypothetical protein
VAQSGNLFILFAGLRGERTAGALLERRDYGHAGERRATGQRGHSEQRTTSKMCIRNHPTNVLVVLKSRPFGSYTLGLQNRTLGRSIREAKNPCVGSTARSKATMWRSNT